MIPAEPAQRLPASARAYWRLWTGLWAVAAVVPALTLSGAADAAGLPGWLPVALVAILGAAAVAVLPAVWWRRWRYEVRDDEIDLRHGTLSVRRTLVPIRRVQHVDTEVGWLQGTFDLATVRFHTAAGATEIPAVPRAEAEAVRARVAELTRTRDDV